MMQSGDLGERSSDSLSALIPFVPFVKSSAIQSSAIQDTTSLSSYIRARLKKL